MADFKKIDDDAVNADQPLDAYVLQGVAENLSAARSKRPRRHAFGWPVDHRPVLACHKNLVYLLGRWPVTPGVQTLTIRMRYTVSETNLNMNVGLLTAGGIRHDDLLVKAAGDHNTSFTLDVAGYQGQLVNVVLIIRSDKVNPVTEYYTDHTIIVGYYRMDLLDEDPTSFPWTAGDRWSVELAAVPAGVSTPDTDLDSNAIPMERTVIWRYGDNYV